MKDFNKSTMLDHFVNVQYSDKILQSKHSTLSFSKNKP